MSQERPAPPLPTAVITALRLLLFGLASLGCFAVGWLAYRLLQPAGSPSSGAAATALAPAPGPTSSAVLPPAAPISPASLPPASSRPGLPPLTAAPLDQAALGCLTGGQAEVPAPADPSNYGERAVRNWKGEPVAHSPSLIVLHETVVDEPTTLALFQRHQSDDLRQASYHVVIGRDGRRIRVVADGKRAFGAGDSDFQGLAVQLRPGIPSSVNNIALHVSLVSPGDGADGERLSHSGYTQAQYSGLARQLALWQSLYGIPSSRIVTHQEVDRSGSRRDPRSFNWSALGGQLQRQLLACGLRPGTAVAR